MKRTKALLLSLVLVSGTAMIGAVRAESLEIAVRRYEAYAYPEAYTLFRDAHKAGDAEAAYYLGRMHEKGEGVSRDYEAATTYYREAAEAGVGPAMFALGTLYEYGLGVRRDPVEARQWYDKAEAAGYTDEQAIPSAAPATTTATRPHLPPVRPPLGSTASSTLPPLGAPRQVDVTWDIHTEVHDTLYPSLIVVASSLRLPEEVVKSDPDTLGDPLGLIGIKIKAPYDRAPVRIELQGNQFIKPSVYETVLPRRGHTYQVNPVIAYDYDALVRNRQPMPETVQVKVFVRGQPVGEKSRRLMVASVNDCLLAITQEGSQQAFFWLMAAYVNENHPHIQVIMKEALDGGLVPAFVGYQDDPASVVKEVGAIWDVLQRRGVKYSSITPASVEEEGLHLQHVRLFSDTIRNTQANCADGTVMLASILYRMSLRPFLIMVPGHMYLGIATTDSDQPDLFIETTMLGSATFQEAITVGAESFQKALPGIQDENDIRYAIVDVAQFRKLGVLPLKDAFME